MTLSSLRIEMTSHNQSDCVEVLQINRGGTEKFQGQGNTIERDAMQRCITCCGN